MKKLLVALVLGAGALTPGVAAADAPRSIGVTGRTAWYPELMQTIGELQRDYGVPIHDGCTGHDLCVTIKDYRKRDGKAGETSWEGRSNTIKLNQKYAERGSYYRRSVLSHEFGHVLGLGHAGCDSSMQPTIGMCGSYVIGYSADEQRMIHERWG